MPQYEYHCHDCEKTFSVFMTVQEHQETPSPVCPHCGGKNVKQTFTGVSVMTSKKS